LQQLSVDGSEGLPEALDIVQLIVSDHVIEVKLDGVGSTEQVEEEGGIQISVVDKLLFLNKVLILHLLCEESARLENLLEWSRYY
jgi:hypothetical protein